MILASSVRVQRFLLSHKKQLSDPTKNDSTTIFLHLLSSKKYQQIIIRIYCELMFFRIYYNKNKVPNALMNK